MHDTKREDEDPIGSKIPGRKGKDEITIKKCYYANNWDEVVGDEKCMRNKINYGRKQYKKKRE